MYRIPAHIKIIAGKQQPGWTDSMWNNEIYQQNSREKYQKSMELNSIELSPTLITKMQPGKPSLLAPQLH